MNDERMDLAARAARHAALADPVRLRLVDLLALGDASPAELGAALGVPSNLLAHHVNVLVAAGLVARSRSQGDRRRTYLHLASGALDEPPAGPSLVVPRVVFVCTANSARSQLAAALWRAASPVPVASAGTHPAPAVEPGALAAAERHGLALAAVTPRPVRDVLARDDLVVTVCDVAREEIGARARLHWSVPDPVRVGTAAAFDAAYDDLARRVETLAAHAAAA